MKAVPSVPVAEVLGMAGLAVAGAAVGGAWLACKGVQAGVASLRKARADERAALRATLRPVCTEALVGPDASATLTLLTKSGACVTDSAVLQPMIQKLSSAITHNGKSTAAASAARELCAAVVNQHHDAIRCAALDILAASVEAAGFARITKRVETGYLLGENNVGESIRVDVFGDPQSGAVGVAMDANGFRDGRCKEALDRVEKEARQRGLVCESMEVHPKLNRACDGHCLPSAALQSCH